MIETGKKGTQGGIFVRLDKWLSDATNYTRSQLKQLIRSGQVTVNDCIVKRPETAVCQTDTICLQGKPVTADTFCYCLLLHKPLGYVCAVTDATEKIRHGVDSAGFTEKRLISSW